MDWQLTNVGSALKINLGKLSRPQGAVGGASMPRLFYYGVQHDYGLSPNPSGGFCTLAFCKFSTSGKRNVVELAEVGDWVIGTGGSHPVSAGHGRLVYAMRVTEKLNLRDYFR